MKEEVGEADEETKDEIFLTHEEGFRCFQKAFNVDGAGT